MLLAAAMKKPPDPHPPPSQPPFQSTTQPFVPRSAYQLRFRSSLCSSTLIHHLYYASCASPPPLVMFWSPPMSQLSISVQTCLLFDQLFGFRSSASRSLHFSGLHPPAPPAVERFFPAVVPAARVHGDSDSGAAKQKELQLSLCSPSLLFSLSVFASLVDGIFSFICDGERSGYWLTRITIFDSTHAHDFGWVVNVSYSGFYVTLTLFRPLIWTISQHLLSNVCFGQSTIFYPTMVGYTSGSLFSSLFRTLDRCYVLTLGLRCFYGFVWILFWVGYCWVSTLNVSMTMILVTQLQWYVHFIWPFYSGCPCYTRMMFVCIDTFVSGWMLIAFEGCLWVLTIYVWLLFMLNCYLDGLMWCFEPCWLLIMDSSELPLVALSGLWSTHEYVLFTGYADVGFLLCCNVPVGILFEWLSICWILCCFHSCCVWQCNVILVYGIGIIMITPCVWQSECAAYFIVLWFSFWGVSISFGSGTKEGCVSGCLSQLSFAPCRGEQPGRRAPRCYLPWSISSVMIRVVTATPLLSSKGICTTQHKTHFFCCHLYLVAFLVVRVSLLFSYRCRLHADMLTTGYGIWLGTSWMHEDQCCGQRIWLHCFSLLLLFLYLLTKKQSVMHDSFSACTVPWNKITENSMASEGHEPSKALYQTALGLRLFFFRFLGNKKLRYAKAELCWREEHSLQIVSGRRSIPQLVSMIWLLLCLASEGRRDWISFRNSKAFFQTAFGLRLHLLWIRFNCLIFGIESSTYNIFLR